MLFWDSGDWMVMKTDQIDRDITLMPNLWH